MSLSRKFQILTSVLVILCTVLVWRWIAGWGLITVNFVDAPLSKVIASVERQGRIKIATNAPLDTKVTLQLKNAPLFEALDTLAVRLDGEMRLTYILARQAKEAAAGANTLATERRPEGWKVFSSGFGGDFGGPSDSVPDYRKISFKPEAGEDRSLHALLEQASQKTGISFAAPSDWNPVLGTLPKSGAASKAAKTIASNAKGKSLEIVFIRVRNSDGAGGPPGEWAGGERGGGGRRGEANPAWVAERMEARIAMLPKEEQAEARNEMETMRKTWQEIRALPEDQRRAKMEELMTRPEVQERMEQRMASRDEKMSADQRASRYQRYLERKQAAQNAGR